jgi:hypothetical protein
MIPVLARIRVPRIGPGRPRTRPDRVLGDKAYSSRANRAYLARRKIKATIPVPADQAAHRRARGSAGGRSPAFDPVAYRDHPHCEHRPLAQATFVTGPSTAVVVRDLAGVAVPGIGHGHR